MRLTRRDTFSDRHEAGRMLAARLTEMDLADPVVIALPRGGVPVGYEVAKALRAPLDIGLVRKLGHPNQPELGLGAIGEDGTVVVDQRAMDAFGVSRDQIEPIAHREADGARPPPAPLPRRRSAGRDPRADRDRRRRRDRHRGHGERRIAGSEGAGRGPRDPRRAGLPGRLAETDRRRHRRDRRARTPPLASAASAPGTTTSRRRPTRRSSTCSRPPAMRPPRMRKSRRRRPERSRSRPPTEPSSGACCGPRRIRPDSSSSSTAAARAGTARATTRSPATSKVVGSRRCCSTC